MAVEQGSSVVVIKESDLNEYGCPVCLVDHRDGSAVISFRGATVFICGNSGRRYLVLADHLEVSPLGFGDTPPGKLSAGVHPKSKRPIGE